MWHSTGSVRHASQLRKRTIYRFTELWVFYSKHTLLVIITAESDCPVCCNVGKERWRGWSYIALLAVVFRWYGSTRPYDTFPRFLPAACLYRSALQDAVWNFFRLSRNCPWNVSFLYYGLADFNSDWSRGSDCWDMSDVENTACPSQWVLHSYCCNNSFLQKDDVSTSQLSSQLILRIFWCWSVVHLWLFRYKLIVRRCVWGITYIRMSVISTSL